MEQAACRLVFMGTGDIAIPAFRWLLENGPRPLALVTQPDKPVGRHQMLEPAAIKIVAQAAGVPVLQPVMAGDAVPALAALGPEIIVVMAYGQILRRDVLDLASKAIINLHASLLPRYRGAACIQAAIDAGDAETGVTAIHVQRELDAGDIIMARRVPIAPDETGGSMHDRLAIVAAEVLAATLPQLIAGNAPRLAQDASRASYVPKLGREDGRLDWRQPAAALERRIRAYDPWPGTFTLAVEAGNSRRLKIYPPVVAVTGLLEPGQLTETAGQLTVGCGKGSLVLSEVQPEGGKRMSAADYLRGRKPACFEVPA